MKNLLSLSKFYFLFVFAFSTLLFASCGCEEDCAEFSNLRMCDSKPIEDGCSSNTIVFSQDAEYLTTSIEIKHGEPEDRLSIRFFVKDGNSFVEFFSSTTPLKDIDEDVNGDERKIRGAFGIPRREDRLWPVAEYKVEVELSQENIPLNATQNFSVE